MTETPLKVSVVCAWYNRADYIRASIDSLLAQDYPNFDITLINDGSPDPRVREILDSYADPRLRVIHQPNAGFTRTIRRAIEESDGFYIAIMGAGDTCLPGRLSAQVALLSANDRHVICGSWYNKVETSGTTLQKPRNVAPLRLNGYSFSHGELMYRRRDYEAAGGYRDFFPVGQGSDLWMRLLRKGEGVVVPELLYQQIIFDDGVSRNLQKIAIRRELDKFRVLNEVVFRFTGRDAINDHGYLAPFAIRSIARGLPMQRRLRLQLSRVIDRSWYFPFWRRIARKLDIWPERLRG
jgi:glycosyltransferase involved in cell wall biosynthesis